MNTNLGLIHIYCGDGKGKTTAATGMAIRAAGNNCRVLISRFLKNSNSCELNILNTIPNITISGSEKDFGFVFNMNYSEKLAASDFFTSQLINAFSTAATENYDMLILDEINVAVSTQLIDSKLVTDLIRNKPANLELILTGRNPSKEMLELADYVSDIHCVKHPYNAGVASRKGIEE